MPLYHILMGFDNLAVEDEETVSDNSTVENGISLSGNEGIGGITAAASGSDENGILPQGKLNASIAYILYNTGLLEISGTGDMPSNHRGWSMGRTLPR